MTEFRWKSKVCRKTVIFPLKMQASNSFMFFFSLSVFRGLQTGFLVSGVLGCLSWSRVQVVFLASGVVSCYFSCRSRTVMPPGPTPALSGEDPMLQMAPQHWNCGNGPTDPAVFERFNSINITDFSEADIQIRGVYYPPGKEPGEGIGFTFLIFYYISG